MKKMSSQMRTHEIFIKYQKKKYLLVNSILFSALKFIHVIKLYKIILYICQNFTLRYYHNEIALISVDIKSYCYISS